MNAALDVKKISKIYGEPPNETIALKNVSLQIKEGEFVAIIGPSGSGKSTLMNILGLLDIPTSGEYFFENRKAANLSQNDLAKLRNQKIGFVFQSFNLLPRTSSLKNVELPLIYSGVGKKEREQKAKEMLERVGLGDKLFSTPAKLSGGQQQRVAIARALVNDPFVIFADEPTGNLDTRSSSEIMQIFKDLNNEGRTIVLITHETDIAKLASRILTMRDGQIVSDVKNRPKKQIIKSKRKGV